MCETVRHLNSQQDNWTSTCQIDMKLGLDIHGSLWMTPDLLPSSTVWSNIYLDHHYLLPQHCSCGISNFFHRHDVITVIMVIMGD